MRASSFNWLLATLLAGRATTGGAPKGQPACTADHAKTLLLNMAGELKLGDNLEAYKEDLQQKSIPTLLHDLQLLGGFTNANDAYRVGDYQTTCAILRKMADEELFLIE